ncbi:MAG: hypothetical protein ABJN69_09950 [Hellea sp.]
MLWLTAAATLTTPLSAQAQINFSQKTPELKRLEARVNDCAKQQTLSSCHQALGQTHILQTSHGTTDNSSDRIMRNAVMLLPLNMLAQLYKRKGRSEVSCGYAQSGERHLKRLLRDLDSLMAQDPSAFKNIDSLKRDLKDVQAKFEPLLKRCD